MVPNLDSGRPVEFFRELVRDASAARHAEPCEESEHYLVQLLAMRLRSGDPFPDEPLAMQLLTGLSGTTPQSFTDLRAVGDTALFVTGLFLQRVEAMLVSPSYFVDLGRIAYQRIAELGAGPMRRLYSGLVNDFPELVEILDEIAHRHLFGGDGDTLRTYRRWLATRGPRETAELLRRGIIPGEPTNSHH